VKIVRAAIHAGGAIPLAQIARHGPVDALQVIESKLNTVAIISLTKNIGGVKQQSFFDILLSFSDW
jgi:hypothetical protein